MKKQELLQHIIQRKRHVLGLIQKSRPKQQSEDLYVSAGAIGALRALNEESVWLDDLIRRIQSKDTTAQSNH